MDIIPLPSTRTDAIGRTRPTTYNRKETKQEEAEQLDTREELAGIAGVSHDTIHKVVEATGRQWAPKTKLGLTSKRLTGYTELTVESVQ